VKLLQVIKKSDLIFFLFLLQKECFIRLILRLSAAGHYGIIWLKYLFFLLLQECLAFPSIYHHIYKYDIV